MRGCEQRVRGVRDFLQQQMRRIGQGLLCPLLVGSLIVGSFIVGSGAVSTQGWATSTLGATEPVTALFQPMSSEIRPNAEFEVAIDLVVKPGWHMGPLGDPEVDPNALSLVWDLPDGFEVVGLTGPTPQEQGVGDLAWRGYVDHVQLLARIHAPSDLPEQKVELVADMDWVACGSHCIPGSTHLSLDLPTRKEAVLQQSVAGALAAPSVDFLAASSSEVTTSLQEFLGWAALAFCGGLLLNLMPCVLPVLSLKAMQLVQLAQEGRRRIIMSTLMYALGVFGSFMALGLLFVLLKSAGVALGWGFQLQSPLFVAGLSGLMVLLGCSLSGAFDLGGGLGRLGDRQPRSAGLLGSFLSGTLTTLVATPCTGPFLGSAMAFGMTLSAAGQLAMMGAMALGLVAPFLLLIPFPGLLKRLPKPGRWMERLKQAMGVLMVASAGWLLWVFTALTDSEAGLWWGAGLLGIGLVALLYGRIQWVVRSQRPGWIKILMPLLTLAVGLCCWQSLQEGNQSLPLVTQEHQFGRARADAVLAQGRAVLVDFTARWCLLCQANKPVLHSAEVQKLLEEKQIVFMEADITRRQPELMAELAALGREGVPAYVVLTPDGNTHFLPELLTVDAIREVVDQIPPPRAK